MTVSLYKKKKAQKFFLYYTSIPVLRLSTSVHCEKKIKQTSSEDEVVLMVLYK